MFIRVPESLGTRLHLEYRLMSLTVYRLISYGLQINVSYCLQINLLRSTDSVDALVIVVKEASLVGTDYDKEDDEGNEIDDGLDDPV